MCFCYGSRLFLTSRRPLGLMHCIPRLCVFLTPPGLCEMHTLVCLHCRSTFVDCCLCFRLLFFHVRSDRAAFFVVLHKNVVSLDVGHTVHSKVPGALRWKVCGYDVLQPCRNSHTLSVKTRLWSLSELLAGCYDRCAIL